MFTVRREDTERQPIKRAKYNFHALRHAAANLFIEHKLSPKCVQTIEQPCIRRNLLRLLLQQIHNDGETDFLVEKLFIICRFSNSIYAAIRLACMGLILDSMGCLKTAFEALQYSRLISLKPDEAPTFLDPEKSLRPVEVRKRLEAVGHDVEAQTLFDAEHLCSRWRNG
ncbi:MULTISPECIES: hypothetical protein [unclassified Mesorhizobium]|uniref:hypothetical protein n=1 Tax=unclassified Mesorhizobium TaxID=325217 RepID=UPI000F74DD71|nr:MULTISPECIES: hypothetical protein [unclassified Mesorhizobium]AZO55317.1 hypothetical protein EJ077_19095 [Mesorhizobium sp. M8A.F.Ca.ET.057.01.1.1]RWE47201.1 MAG: hypothetical protein EOS80_11010 [Mesorhizobium sp.]